MEFIIREARKEDAQTLIEYVNKVAVETDNLTFGLNEFGMTIEDEENFLTQSANHQDALYLLAFVGSQIVGSLSFSPGHRKRIAHAGEFGISVLKSHWGKGIGRGLIVEMINRCRKNGRIRKLNLRVRTDNTRAIALYESLGFVHEGRITRDFQIDGVFYDTYHMGIEL